MFKFIKNLIDASKREEKIKAEEEKQRKIEHAKICVQAYFHNKNSEPFYWSCGYDEYVYAVIEETLKEKREWDEKLAFRAKWSEMASKEKNHGTKKK